MPNIYTPLYHKFDKVVKLDIKNAYMHFDASPQLQKLLGFQLGGKYY